MLKELIDGLNQEFENNRCKIEELESEVRASKLEAEAWKALAQSRRPTERVSASFLTPEGERVRQQRREEIDALRQRGREALSTNSNPPAFEGGEEERKEIERGLADFYRNQYYRGDK